MEEAMRPADPEYNYTTRKIMEQGLGMLEDERQTGSKQDVYTQLIRCGCLGCTGGIRLLDAMNDRNTVCQVLRSMVYEDIQVVCKKLGCSLKLWEGVISGIVNVVDYYLIFIRLCQSVQIQTSIAVALRTWIRMCVSEVISTAYNNLDVEDIRRASSETFTKKELSFLWGKNMPPMKKMLALGIPPEACCCEIHCGWLSELQCRRDVNHLRDMAEDTCCVLGMFDFTGVSERYTESLAKVSDWLIDLAYSNKTINVGELMSGLFIALRTDIKARVRECTNDRWITGRGTPVTEGFCKTSMIMFQSWDSGVCGMVTWSDNYEEGLESSYIVRLTNDTYDFRTDIIRGERSNLHYMFDIDIGQELVKPTYQFFSHAITCNDFIGHSIIMRCMAPMKYSLVSGRNSTVIKLIEEFEAGVRVINKKDCHYCTSILHWKEEDHNIIHYEPDEIATIRRTAEEVRSTEALHLGADFAEYCVDWLSQAPFTYRAIRAALDNSMRDDLLQTAVAHLSIFYGIDRRVRNGWQHRIWDTISRICGATSMELQQRRVLVEIALYVLEHGHYCLGTYEQDRKLLAKIRANNK